MNSRWGSGHHLREGGVGRVIGVVGAEAGAIYSLLAAQVRPVVAANKVKEVEDCGSGSALGKQGAAAGARQTQHSTQHPTVPPHVLDDKFAVRVCKSALQSS